MPKTNGNPKKPIIFMIIVKQFFKYYLKYVFRIQSLKTLEFIAGSSHIRVIMRSQEILNLSSLVNLD